MNNCDAMSIDARFLNRVQNFTWIHSINDKNLILYDQGASKIINFMSYQLKSNVNQ